LIKLHKLLTNDVIDSVVEEMLSGAEGLKETFEVIAVRRSRSYPMTTEDIYQEIESATREATKCLIAKLQELPWMKGV
jgi:hypothetical protein